MNRFLRVRSDGLVVGTVNSNVAPSDTDSHFYVPYQQEFQLPHPLSKKVHVWRNRLVEVDAPTSPDATWDSKSMCWVDNRAVAEVIESTLSKVRSKRNELLADSDWTQMPDSPLNDTQRTAWQQYRQQLRDITDEYPEPTSLDDIQWPTPPSV